MMSEKRFKKMDTIIDPFPILDTVEELGYNCTDTLDLLVDLLNEQESTIQSLKEENEQLQKYNEQLKERLEKINGGYGHLTHRNGLTANEWLIESQERELKKKNEQISDWIEQHGKDVVKIGEQKATIKQLEEENRKLKKRLEHYAKVEAMNGDGKNE